MSATTRKGIAVIAGIGNGTGTRIFVAMNLPRAQSLLADSLIHLLIARRCRRVVCVSIFPVTCLGIVRRRV